MEKNRFINRLGLKHKIIRLLWSMLWTLTAKWLPRSIGVSWRRILLRLFGAKISNKAMIYSSAKIYMPSNLIMDDYSCIASDVDCYNVALIHIGKFATVSQGAMLCTASHDIEDEGHKLITAPINIKERVWIGAKAFVGMGVTIEEGAVVGATASVYKNVAAWTVVGGNPAKFIKQRIIKNA